MRFAYPYRHTVGAGRSLVEAATISANRFGAAALLVSVPGWTPATERAECYGFVMAAWHRPDRELLPYLAEARKGLAPLRVE